MAIGERIKRLRKELALTQQEFADKLKLSRSNIATYEVGKNNPAEAVMNLICREFNVSETWLRTGEGEMFSPKEEDALEELVKRRGLTQSDRILIEKFMDLKPASRQAVMEYMKKVVAALNEETALHDYEPTPVVDTTGQEQTELDWRGQGIDMAAIDKQVELYRQQLLSEQERARQARFVNGSDVG